MRGYELLDKMSLVNFCYVEAADKPINSQKHRWTKYWLAVACLCLIIGASVLLIPNSENSFAIKAYAVETADDGAIELRETNLLNQPDVWGGHYDGENFYVSVGLRYEGNNIESVEFMVDEGFFAKQYVSHLKQENNAPCLYVGADNELVMYGIEFEIVGNTITLNDETMTEDLLLFWGTQANNYCEVSEHIIINATATFLDGRTQEITIPIDLSGIGVVIDSVSDTILQQQISESDYYKNLSLSECELVEDSIESVTDVYEVQVGSSLSRYEIHSEMEFDEDGTWRGGYITNPNKGSYDVYIPVIQRNTSGVFTGMLYLVPEELHYVP